MGIILRVVLAVIGGLNTAIPLILDAQQLFPSWPWQIHALAGFVVFTLVMIWIVLSYSIPLHKIETSKPKIEFRSKGEWQFYTNKQAIYRALQVWFVNNPEVTSDNSIAKDVTARIIFYDRNAKNKLEIFGCFTEAEVLDYATIAPPQHLKDKIDVWSPNAIPQKLLIALKYPDDGSAYAYAKSNFLVAAQDGREEVKQIKKGSHYVEVAFNGTRVDQPSLWFVLDNPGQSGNLSITEPIKKPNLRKEGFQT